MSTSTLKGTIINSNGEKSDISLNGNLRIRNNNNVSVNLDSTNKELQAIKEKLVTIDTDLKQKFDENSKNLNLRDRMIMGEKFYSGYPVNYNDFMDVNKKGDDFNNYFTLNEETSEYELTDQNSITLESDKNYSLTPGRTYHINQIIIVENSNIWLHGSTLKISDNGLLVLKGNTSIFGGKITSSKISYGATVNRLDEKFTILITDNGNENAVVNINNIYFDIMPETKQTSLSDHETSVIGIFGKISKLNCLHNIVKINLDENEFGISGKQTINKIGRYIRYIQTLFTSKSNTWSPTLDSQIISKLTLTESKKCEITIENNDIIGSFKEYANISISETPNDVNQSHGFYLIAHNHDLKFINNNVNLSGISVLFDYRAQSYKSNYMIENCSFSLNDVVSIFRMSPNNVYITNTDLEVNKTREGIPGNYDLINKNYPDLITFGRQMGSNQTDISYHIYDSTFKNRLGNDIFGILFEKYDINGKKFRLTLNNKSIINTAILEKKDLLKISTGEVTTNQQRFEYNRLGLSFNETFNYNDDEKPCDFYLIKSNEFSVISGTDNIPEQGYGIDVTTPTA